MSKNMRGYFGLGEQNFNTVPGDANLMGFIVQGDTPLDKRRLINHIPFQYIEKVPNWTKEAMYEESQIPGRFENIMSYNQSGNNQIDLQLLYYAEKDDPFDPILNVADNRGSSRSTIKDLNNIQRDAQRNYTQDFLANPPSSQEDFFSRVDQQFQDVQRLSKNRIDQFINKNKFGEKPTFETHWSIQKILVYIQRLKSLVYPEYDGFYSGPKSLLLNIGETWWDVPVVIKSISIEHNAPFDIKNMLSRFYVVNITMSTSYPMYQAISASAVYNSRTNEVFARKTYNLAFQGIE
jgi:hypothetical protein